MLRWSHGWSARFGLAFGLVVIGRSVVRAHHCSGTLLPTADRRSLPPNDEQQHPSPSGPASTYATRGRGHRARPSDASSEVLCFFRAHAGEQPTKGLREQVIGDVGGIDAALVRKALEETEDDRGRQPRGDFR
jgi:hypothetical protein